eukprot:366140_1
MAGTFQTTTDVCLDNLNSGFMPIPMSTENYDYFSPLYKRINDEIIDENANVEEEDQYRFVTAGFPIRNVNVLLWEYHFTDGRATNADREVHLTLKNNGLFLCFKSLFVC